MSSDKHCPSDEDEYDYDYSDDPNLVKSKLSGFPEIEVQLMSIHKGYKNVDCIKGLYVDGVKQPRHKHVYLNLLSQVVAKRQSSHELTDEEFVDLCLKWCLAWGKMLHSPAETVAPHGREGLTVYGLKDFHPPTAKIHHLPGRYVVQVRYWIAPSVGNEPVVHYQEKVLIFDRKTGQEITDEIFALPEHDRHSEFPAPRAFEYWL